MRFKVSTACIWVLIAQTMLESTAFALDQSAVLAVNNVKDGAVIQDKDVKDINLDTNELPAECLRKKVDAVGRLSLGIRKGQVLIHKKGRMGLSGITLLRGDNAACSKLKARPHK